MSRAVNGPVSRLVPVHRLPPGGLDVTVKVTAEESAALAADLGIPAIRDLDARYHVMPTRTGVHVEGRLTATVSQVCVVTLDTFESRIEEPVEVDFQEPAQASRRRAPEPEEEADLDRPDEIVDGRVDLGATTAEFLALALDPYPRKPGVEFVYRDAEDEAGAAPLAGLGAALKDGS
jgi:hypothetical protein